MENKLETERLLLQRPKLEDLNELFLLCSKPEVNLFNPAGPDNSIDESRCRLEGFIKDWETNEIGYYSVRLKSNGEYLGYIGVRKTKFLEMDVLNLAYRINPEFQRQGYTYEACSFILKNIDLPIPIMVLTKEDNLPSFHLAMKLGFIHNPKYNNYPEPKDVYLFSVKQGNYEQIK